MLPFTLHKQVGIENKSCRIKMCTIYQSYCYIFYPNISPSLNGWVHKQYLHEYIMCIQSLWTYSLGSKHKFKTPISSFLDLTEYSTEQLRSMLLYSNVEILQLCSYHWIGLNGSSQYSKSTQDWSGKTCRLWPKTYAECYWGNQSLVT